MLHFAWQLDQERHIFEGEAWCFGVERAQAPLLGASQLVREFGERL